MGIIHPRSLLLAHPTQSPESYTQTRDFSF